MFVDQPLGQGQAVALDEGQANYLFSVMRLGAGDAVHLFNGRDGEWRARHVDAPADLVVAPGATADPTWNDSPTAALGDRRATAPRYARASRTRGIGSPARRNCATSRTRHTSRNE